MGFKEEHKLQLKPTKDLIPYINNSRTHSEQQIQQVASSIQEFGFTNPILIDQDQGIIAGHGRLQAAQLLGLDEVPTITITGWTAAQKKAYVIADNKLALNAGWDDSLLKIEMESLINLDFDLNAIGFTESEMLNIMLDREQGETDPEAEWTDMPEFDQPDIQSFRKVAVHFENQDDCDEFFSLIGQTDKGKTKSIWHPQQESNDLEGVRYK